jgi:hypothetical protein
MTDCFTPLHFLAAIFGYVVGKLLVNWFGWDSRD